MSIYAYARISDKNRQTIDTQINSIKQYAEKHGLIIDEFVTEAKSGSRTEMSDRQLSELLAKLNQDDHLIITEVSRLGRSRPMQIMGLLDELTHSKGITIHLTYSDAAIHKDNIDDPTMFFQIVGAGFVAQQEAKRRSDRAKAHHARRKAEGKDAGRKKGAIVSSFLDEHEWLIDISLDNHNSNISKAAHELVSNIKRDGKELNPSTFRSQLSRWLKRREELKQLAIEHRVPPSLTCADIVVQLQSKKVTV
ncbi:DNA invertase Pin-like site-specific DNA recombinase [Vibrio crassostreae]|uniref:recombinase family protein n=1 Tax=Vibrio crassostreae TaxID=246167 RepID=UPI001051606F|nr:recombinase family protein [Vibrio crassostreae]TCN64010.1 DNA invertase Pin-like site-specific DNA recombinase [Vibrio crassostreae]